MTLDIDAKPESPRLPLFGRVGAYFCLTSEFSRKCASLYHILDVVSCRL